METEIFTSATLVPEEVFAADSTEFSIKLILGPGYTDKASRIVFDFSCTLGTSCPTRQINECNGYVETYVDNPDVEYEIKCWDLDYKHFVDREHAPSREAMRMIVLDLSGGLKEGDKIELKWGETFGGFGPGAKVSSLVPRPNYKARIDVRYFDAQDKGMPDYGRDYMGYKRPEPDAMLRLHYKIRPRETRCLRMLKKLSHTLIVPYDMFWNVPEIDNPAEIFESNSKPEKNEYGVFEFINKNVTVKPRNLPMTESPLMEDVFDGMNIFWGDMHVHSAYSIDCAQRSGMDMTPADLMDSARYRAGLDFFAVTDHHIPYKEPIQHIGQEKWTATLNDISEKHKEHEFVVFSGIEFTDLFGDICLIFRGLPDYEKITSQHIEEVSDFYKLFGKDMLAIPHLHAPGNPSTEGIWRQGIAEISPVLEIYSDHGSYEREKVFENGRAWCKTFRKDRCAEFFIKSGFKYGFVANSDDHKGHAGMNGLTAVFSKELTKESIFEAYHKRHVYATTNARIRLVFTGNGELMGGTVPLGNEKIFLIDIQAENKLKKVELFRNGDFYKRFLPDEKMFKTEIKIDDDTPDNWYIRATQVDNHIAYSSPIWFE
ncbi:MAG: hypothetical protein A2017_10115 [Lentisphaerae bacterium GWF2_44_16]|nr:MAG: hypothetical protein A2017_10115 [Lentisphaerae bacterium GWF2_44_16]